MKMRTSKNLLEENSGKLLDSAGGTRTEWKDDGKTSEQTKYICVLNLRGDPAGRFKRTNEEIQEPLENEAKF